MAAGAQPKAADAIHRDRPAAARNLKIEVRPLAGALGARILGVDLSRPLGDSTFADIYRTFLDYLVVFFPGQRALSPEQHTAFAARFGEVDLEPFAYPFKTPTVPGHSQILLNIKEAADTTINVGGLWHSDVTYRERPHKAGIIYAKDVPPFGGDTVFANQYLAYETLSEAMRQMLAPLKAVHSSSMVHGDESARFASVSRTRAPSPVERSGAKSMYAQSDYASVSAFEHPVVRVHPETGRACLYVNRGFVERIAGMTREESLPLLGFLWEHASRLEFTCRYTWSPNDVGVWDNRCTLHYALNDYAGERREMHRVSVHEPSAPAAPAAP
jgi:taurine dioxygenase